MKYSKYQEAIFSAVKDTNDSYVIEAVAGSGKTSTIIKSLDFVSAWSKATFIAFNKSIVRELAGKLPNHVPASTWHSLGLKNIFNTFGRKKVEVEIDKSLRIFKSLKGEYGTFGAVSRLVGLAKAEGEEDVNMSKIFNSYGIVVESDKVAKTIQMAEDIFRLSLSDLGHIDFDDMLLFNAVGYATNYETFTHLFVDESQDTNNAQIKMLLRSVGNDGRSIAVGDRKQSIYRFRGADTLAMDRITHETHATNLPLSICYRCGKDIVRLAQTIVPQIEYFEENENGIIADTSFSNLLLNAKTGDMVLCRTNAPLISACLKFISSGKKATVRGRDIGKNLKVLLRKVQKKYPIASDLVDTLKYIDIYIREEYYKLVAIEREVAAHALLDQKETLFALADGCNTVKELEYRMDTIFSDEVTPIVLSSIHRAKGMESNRVFILRPDLLPHPAAKTMEDKEQEMNLKYVAITRAKKELYWVVE